MIPRRAFLAGLAASLAAPALVRAASLDYVPRKLILPPEPAFYWGVREVVSGRIVQSGPLEGTTLKITGGLLPDTEYRVEIVPAPIVRAPLTIPDRAAL